MLFDIKKSNFVHHYIPHRYFRITLWLKCTNYCWSEHLPVGIKKL